MADQGWTEEEFTGRLNWPLWRRVLRHAWPYRRRLAPLALAAVLTAACDAAFNLVTLRVIDLAVSGQRAGLWLCGLAYLGLVVVIGACIWMFIYQAGRCSTGISHDIRREAFARLQELEFAYYDRRPVGWLMARLTSDCQRLSAVLSWGLLDLIWGVALMSAIAGVILWLHWRLALVVFVVIPPLAAVSLYFQRIILASSRAVRKVNSQLTAAYNEGIMAVRTTKTLAREEANLEEFRRLSGGMFTASVRNAVQSALYLPIVLTIGSLGAGLALWQGGVGAAAGAISLGTLVAFMGYATQFFGPVHELARVFTEVQAAQASAERVLGLLATEPAIRDSDEVRAAIARASSGPSVPGAAPDGLPGRIGRIEFRGVSFAYKPGQPVLSDFNLSVEPGRTVALVGPTGGGKTTIVSLLCRFYEPTTGQVLIDGTDCRRRPLRWFQSRLGIVLQTPHLFSGTVRENIRYGRLDATDAQVEQAARLVNAHPFIAAMERGYDSEVGQAGSRLSTGQKQLVSFARAVLADPDIFVMDEATSSVDTETERLIQQGLSSVLSGRTSFVIAHRLSTIRSADLILVIEGGRVVEQGTHHDLILAGGRYYELYTSQFTREKEDELLGPALERRLADARAGD